MSSNTWFSFKSIDLKNYEGQNNAKRFTKEFAEQISRHKGIQDAECIYNFTIKQIMELLKKIKGQLNSGARDISFEIDANLEFNSDSHTITGYLEAALQHAGQNQEAGPERSEEKHSRQPKQPKQNQSRPNTRTGVSSKEEELRVKFIELNSMAESDNVEINVDNLITGILQLQEDITKFQNGQRKKIKIYNNDLLEDLVRNLVKKVLPNTDNLDAPRSERFPKVFTKNSDANTWKCQFCGLENANDKEQCETCSGDKPDSQSNNPRLSFSVSLSSEEEEEEEEAAAEEEEEEKKKETPSISFVGDSPSQSQASSQDNQLVPNAICKKCLMDPDTKRWSCQSCEDIRNAPASRSASKDSAPKPAPTTTAKSFGNMVNYVAKTAQSLASKITQ